MTSRELVREARQQIIERLHAETQRQLGRGAELERILFVGGGAVALADDIQDWFPESGDRAASRLRQRAGDAQVPEVRLPGARTP